MFWLAHHREDELDRTYAFGGLHVCARCLGTYPVLFAAIAVQGVLRAPLAWRFDVPWALLLLLPALIDWARGRFRPHAGTNPGRSATGVLLGLALGRTLFIHFQRPWPLALVLQAALVVAVAGPVLVVASRRATPQPSDPEHTPGPPDNAP